MNIGGIDVVLQVVDPSVPIADIILQAARRLWPGCVVQDADQSQTFGNDDPNLWLNGIASREFFIYRNLDAAISWNQAGGTLENQQTMLHFLIGGRAADNPCVRELTVVVGALTEEMARFVDDLKGAVCPRIMPNDRS